MNVLITGATGFVGAYLVPALVEQNAGCRLLVRDRQAAQQRFPREVECVQGDVTKPETLKDIANGMTHVVHLAALGHVSAISAQAWRDFVYVNVQGTSNLISACAGQGVTRLLHFSSTAAMGLIRKQGRVDETDRPRPATPYQHSKLQSETTALEKGRELGLPVVVLRPCMIYGKGGYGEFFKMADLMRKGLFPKVGRGRNLTPLVHVCDVVQAALAALDRGKPGEVYLIASERSPALDELRDWIMQAWGKQALYPYIPVWLMYAAAWGFEQLARITGNAPLATRRNIANTVWDREFSIAKAHRDLDYQPQVNFEDGIDEVVRWYRETSES